MRAATILAVVLGGSLAFAAPQLPCNSVSEYRAVLEYVAEASKSPSLDPDGLIASVPTECSLESGGRKFNFSTVQIHAELFEIKNADKEHRVSEVEKLERDVATRIKGLDGYTTSVDPTAKPKLTQIFTGKEFKRVGTQDAKAVLSEFLIRLLVKLFSFIARNPEQATLFAQIFIWLIVGAVTIFILWKLFHWVTLERPSFAPREIIPFAPSAKSWQQWMIEARASLAAGELREAVHSSYWAAISHLETSGAWIPDKARTPREYLRLIAFSDPARPLLTEISRIFEVVWYGERIPAPEECKAFLARVERIACL